MSAKIEKTSRLSIDVSLSDHKRLKVLAAAEGKTLRAFVTECIHDRIRSEKAPNGKTRKAMLDAEKGKTTKIKSFAGLCKELGI